MTELLLIVDMIKNGTEQDNEGNDSYTLDDFVDGRETRLKCAGCGTKKNVKLSAIGNFMPYCKECMGLYNTKER